MVFYPFNNNNNPDRMLTMGETVFYALYTY